MGVLERTRFTALSGMQVTLLIATLAVYAALGALDVAVTHAVWLTAAIVLLLAGLVASFTRPSDGRRAAWTLGVLLADIAAITMMRTGMLDSISTISLFAVLPIVWLAGGFPRWGALLGIGSAVLLGVVPRAITGEWVTGRVELLQESLPTVALVILAIATNVGAQAFQRQRDLLDATLAAKATAADDAADRSALSRSIIDSLDLGIAVFAPDGTLRTANAAAHRFAELEGIRLATPRIRAETVPVFQSDRHTLLPDDERVILAAAAGVERTTRTVWVGGPGNQVALSKSSRHVVRSDGEMMGTMLVTREVTEEERSRQMRHDFLAAVSHELRTPLTPLLGHLDLLADDLAGDPRSRRLDVLHRNLERLSDRMDEIAAASEVEPQPVLQPADLAALVTVAVARRSAAASRRRIAIAVDGPTSLTLRADGARLTRAVDALIGNAIKFSPDGSTVVVTLRGDADAVELRVSDTGPGIPADEEHLLFEPFMRGRYAHENAIGGFGLGLTQAMGTVRSHHGELRVHSPDDTGTVAVLRLPR
ncbi:ATP-binding protein [Microbacterium sp. NPDC089189]|uniref:sensor histidine kinase n=1 Tax=Microbacterium sp. NPDC089189 TaxID=3154972 RepID=UPI0034282335